MEEKKGLSIAVKVLTIAFALALVAFVVFFSIQLYRSTIFDLFDEVYITDNLKDAYNKNDNIRTHSVGTEGLSQNGIVKVTELVYIESLDKDGKETGLGYMQFGARINKLHIEEVQEFCPNLKYEDISFFLVGTNGDTNVFTMELANLEERENESSKLLDDGEKYQYVFFKLEANNVRLDCEKLFLEMRLNGVVLGKNDKGESALLEGDGYHTAESTEIHSKDRKSIKYEFSKSEKKQLP